MLEPRTITDLNDPRVDPYRNVRDADLRGREHLFMAESELVVRRLLRTPERLHSLFLSPNKYERLREAIEYAQAAGGTFPIYLADVALISEVAGFHIHRGALAAGFRPSRDALRLGNALAHLRDLERFTIVLAEGIVNVDNMGGLFRNAAAFGVDGIVLDPTCCDPLYRKAIRVSAGHALSVPYAVSEDWLNDLARLKAALGLMLIGAESEDETGSSQIEPLWKMPQSPRLGVIFGSEALGLSRPVRAMCDGLFRIPMASQVSSLNVAAASAVVLYERIRESEPRPRKRSGAGHESNSR